MAKNVRVPRGKDPTKNHRARMSYHRTGTKAYCSCGAQSTRMSAVEAIAWFQDHLHGLRGS